MTPYTKDRPTKAHDFCWFRSDADTPAYIGIVETIVYVTDVYGGDAWCNIVAADGGYFRASLMGGHFSGPIPEPPKPEGAK